MDTLQIDELLAAHKKNAARAGYLRAQIAQLEMAIREIESSAADISARALNGMPHGSGISDPTARKAIGLASGIQDGDIGFFQRAIADYRRQLGVIEIEMEFVQAWLTVLNAREKWVVENQLIAQLTWREVIEGYNAYFGDDANKDRLKKVKARAREKIYEIAR